jgi:phage tail sheath protein FI
MARSINSPGVQITEIDLSDYAQTIAGTNIFATGFASQGPTDEVITVTSTSELEQIYGRPTNAAERYFHHTCKQILNSPGTLLTSRLPYGSGSGAGFSTNYGVLFFPVASSSSGFIIGRPTLSSVNETDYNNLIQGNYNWGSVTSYTTTTTATQTSAAAGIPWSLSATWVNDLSALTPPGFGATITSVNSTLSTVTIQYSYNATVALSSAGTGSYDSQNNIVNAGIILVNTSQTSINQNYEGYYVAITDNTSFGPDQPFNSVGDIFGLDDSGKTFESVPVTSRSFTMSSTEVLAGTNSISEVIEGIPTFNYGDNYYKDSTIVTLFKVRESIYEPDVLTISLAESFIGSFDPNKKIAANTGGANKTFYIQDIINTNSNNLNMFINPAISNNVNWADPNSVNPSKSVVNDGSNKALFTTSVYTPTYTETNKVIGNITEKLERALTLIESNENVSLDVVVDGGLSTINAITNGGNTYSDADYLDTTVLTNENSSQIIGWKSIFNAFDNFTKNIRKDCVFISDPLRQIFVNGDNTKRIDLKLSTFTNTIYTPLKKLYENANTSYSVAYGNWVRAYDVAIDKPVWVPASGFIAGMYARTDFNTQPWIAPAGLTRGVLSNVLDLGFNPNQKQRDFLYNIGINPIVFFQSDGFVVFGQKTLQKRPSAFDRINVRRLFLSLEKATLQALRYFVFEPNTEFTRTRLINTLTPIFENAKNTEGLYDFLIVCDERNNTPGSIDRNELLVDIYIKPVKAAEFILVNFIATRTGQNFEELI